MDKVNPYHPLKSYYQGRPTSIYRFLNEYMRLLQQPIDAQYDEDVAVFSKTYADFEDPELDQEQFYALSTHNLEDLLVGSVAIAVHNQL